MSKIPRRTVYVIANSHIDPIWQWRWPEGCSEIRSTCRAMVDLLHDEPDLKFSRSSAGDMSWLVDMEPQLVKRIRQLVRDRRWENVGGWWTQPDCNIPSGESFVRQALYGQAFFRTELGAPARVGYNVDSFGHHANLPQILKKCGLPYYVFMRPSTILENSGLPEGYFQWEGVDGSRVTAYHIFDPYNATEFWGFDEQYKGIEQYLRQSGGRSAMFFIGTGDHGGAPTRGVMAKVKKMQEQPGLPRLVYATPPEAFAALEREGRKLPVFKGELQHHASGCYAAHSEIKRLNRRAEEALLAAERMSAAAGVLLRQPAPAATLAAAWRDLLTCQFHDVMAGSAVREAYVDARDQLGRAIFTAEEVLNKAQQQLAAHVNTRGDGQAVMLFNPHAFPIKGLYETENVSGGAEHWIYDIAKVCFFTPDGRGLPIQRVRPTSTSGGTERFVFPVDLPPLGYSLYRMKAVESFPRARAGLRVSENSLSNDLLRVTVRPQGIEIYDRAHRRAVLRQPGIRALVIDDPTDTWGHDVNIFDKVAGAFKLVGVRAIERGPLRGALRAEYRFGKSRLWLDILLEHDRNAVELRGKVWWLERNRMLKMSFPVAVRTRTSTHEIPYAALERPNNGEEEPIQQWVGLADAQHGLTVINDGKYSVSVAGREIRQTILRSSPYAWCKCKMYPWPGENVKWRDEDWMMDQGIEEFRLLLVPHAGKRDTGTIMETARLFNRSPMMLFESAHEGKLPRAFGFVRVRGRNVRVEVVKGAEDAKGLIVRAVEVAGKRTSVSFSLPAMAARWKATFAPWEIKTFRVLNGKVREQSLLEARW